MKKIISIALCLIMLVSFAALAENDKAQIGSLEVNGEFILTAAVPEGYIIDLLAEDSFASTWIIFDESDALKPVMYLTIGYDEAYSNIERLNDMDEQALKALEATWTFEYEVEITYTETSHGTKLMQVIEVGDYTDYATLFTIYEGYCIEFVLIAGFDENAELTSDNIRAAIDFLSDLDFVAVEA